MFVHDLIKMKLVKRGYLPNYPYHLISDEEMCDAFLKYNPDNSDSDWDEFKNSDELCYFKDYYPLLDESFEDEYRNLVTNIAYFLNILKSTNEDSYKLPDWVYSYMLDCVISVNSNKQDIHDMLVYMGIDNLDDDFLPIAQENCYYYSKQWLTKMTEEELDHRSPTIFGEPHVIKLLRLIDLDTTRDG